MKGYIVAASIAVVVWLAVFAVVLDARAQWEDLPPEEVDQWAGEMSDEMGLEELYQWCKTLPPTVDPRNYECTEFHPQIPSCCIGTFEKIERSPYPVVGEGRHCIRLLAIQLAIADADAQCRGSDQLRDPSVAGNATWSFGGPASGACERESHENTRPHLGIYDVVKLFGWCDP